MSKQNLIIPCACGYNNCRCEMTVREDDENKNLTILSIPNEKDPLRPKFFTLDRDGALALAKWLSSAYKLRGELSGLSEVKPLLKSKKKVEEPLPTAEELVEEGQLELFEEQERQEEKAIQEQPKKRGRGRPKKIT